MEVRCSICGKKEELTKIHKDFQKLRKNPHAPYICNYCSNKVQYQAKEEQKPKRPL